MIEQDTLATFNGHGPEKTEVFMSSASSAEVSGSVSVRLGKGVHQIVKEYSDLTGVPMSRVMETALTDWMSTVGAARLETLRLDVPRPSGALLQFPNEAKKAAN